MAMLIVSLLIYLTVTFAFVTRTPLAPKSSLFRNRNHVVFSSVESEEVIEKMELKELFWITPEGLNIEVLAKDARTVVVNKPVNERVYGSVVRFLKRITNNAEQPVRTQHKAPILFVHGSFHAAWCYAENYLDYFSLLGHQCFAISLRGTSTTGMPPLDPGEVVRIEQHVSDIKVALASMKASISERLTDSDIPDPIIVSHSFGGLIVMKLLEDTEIRKNISGACFLCSVPPSGNGPMTQRFIKSKFLASMKIVWGFVFKAATNDLPLCRELFFDKTVPSKDIETYMTHFRADSRVSLDLQGLDAVLPSMISMDHEGRADWLPPVDVTDGTDLFKIDQKISDGSIYNREDDKNNSDNSVAGDSKQNSVESKSKNRICPSMLVIGAENDFIVDLEGVKETAQFLGVQPVFIPGLYHDVMLGPKWKLSAEIIADWVKKI